MTVGLVRAGELKYEQEKERPSLSNMHAGRLGPVRLEYWAD